MIYRILSALPIFQLNFHRDFFKIFYQNFNPSSFRNFWRRFFWNFTISRIPPRVRSGISTGVAFGNSLGIFATILEGFLAMFLMGFLKFLLSLKLDFSWNVWSISARYKSRSFSQNLFSLPIFSKFLQYSLLGFLPKIVLWLLPFLADVLPDFYLSSSLDFCRISVEILAEI